MQKSKYAIWLWGIIVLAGFALAQPDNVVSVGEKPQAIAKISSLKADVSSIPKLLEIVSASGTPEVTDTAIALLEKIGTQEQAAANAMVELSLKKNKSISDKAREKLIAGGKWTVAMRKLIFDRDNQYRREVALLLAERGTDEIPVLQKLFRSANEQSRIIAIEGLGKIGPSAVFPLFALIDDKENLPLRQDVVKVLQAMGISAVKPLAVSLTAPRKPVREISKEALVLIGKDVIAPCLEVFYMNPSPQLSEALQEVFFKIGNPSILLVAPLTTHQLPLVRDMAEKTIIKFGDRAFPLLINYYKAAKTEKGKLQGLICISDIAPQNKNQVETLLPLLRPLLKEKGMLQYQAFRVIRSMGPMSRQFLPELKAGLSAEEWKIRNEAAYALANAGKSAKPALKLLMARLNQEEYGEVKIGICKAIGNMGKIAKPAVKNLIKCLENEDEIVIITAAKALGKIGPPAKAAIPKLISTFSWVSGHEGKTISWALAQMGASALYPLKKALHRGEYESERAGVALALGNMGTTAKPAVRDLLRALQFDVEVVKLSAAFALGEIGDTSDRVIKTLINATGDSEMLTEEVGKALGKLGKPATRRIELTLKHSRNTMTRVAMIHALAYMKSEASASLPLLLKILRKAKSIEEKKAIIEALGKIGQDSQEAMPVLIDLLQIERDPEFHEVLRESLVQFGIQAIPQLIPLLSSKGETQKSLFYIFIKLGDAATPYLREEIRADNDPQVVVNALKILAENAENTDIVITSLTFESSLVRNQAVKLLIEKIGSQAIPKLLTALLECKTTEKRILIREPLVRMGPQAVPVLVEIVQTDRKKESRIIAIDTLAEIGPRADHAVDSLEKTLYRSSLDEQLRIIHCLGKIGSAAIPTLVKLLAHKNETIRHTVIKSLGDTNSEEAVLYILKTLENPELLPVVIKATVGMKQIAVPVLLNSLQDKSKYVRFACAAAIFEISAPQAIPYLEIQVQLEKDPMVKYMLATALNSCRQSAQ